MKPVVETVHHGSLKIDLRQFADGRYGYHYRDQYGAIVRVLRHSLDDAREAAAAMLANGAAGRVDIARVDREEYEEFLRWKAARGCNRKLSDLAREYLAMKVARGVSAYRAKELRLDLALIAERFDEPLHTIQGRDVEEWLNGRGVGWKRWNDLLATFIGLIRWARKNRIVGAELTTVEAIEKRARPRKASRKVATYTRPQLEAWLAAVPQEWHPLIMLGAWAGLRPEEICPQPESGKTGLDWSNVNWEAGRITVPASVSKDGRKRLVPILDALRVLRNGAPTSGPVFQPCKVSNKVRKWKEGTGLEWIQDGWRHSFASYRLALVKDAGQVAEEMGNSVSIIREHYLDAQTPEDAEKWFAPVQKVQ